VIAPRAPLDPGYHPAVPRPLALALAAAALLAPACKERREVVVFHAASLSRLFADVGERFERRHPGYVLRAEPSGSQVAARKVAELGLRADLVVLADVRVLAQMLVPGHADWTLGFATNEIVLARGAHSRFASEVSGATWPEVLTRPGVRLGRVDPDLAPVGYQALLAWHLAGRGAGRADLAARLAAACAPEHVVSDESELVALLEARAVDYAFLYRSTAEDHRLPVVELPPAVNLSRADLAPAYALAEVEVRMRSSEPRVRIQGSPLVYGMAVPRSAPGAEGGLLLAAFLLGEEGRAALRRAGFRPLAPATSDAPERLPPALRALAGAPR